MTDTPPQITPQAATARRVHQLIEVHPLLAPLREAGERVLVSCHARAIWLSAVRTLDGTQWELKSTIEHSEWWDTRGASREVWAHSQPLRQPVQMREGWDARR